MTHRRANHAATPHRFWERAAAVGLAALAGLALARVFAHDAWMLLAWANCLTPWVYLPAWPVLGLALWRRRAGLAVVAGAIVIAHVSWTAPGLVADEIRVPEDAPRLRVLSANLLNVHADPAALARELLGQGADVMVLIEVSARWAEQLDAPAMLARYPHREVIARTDARGIAILSRRPLTGVRRGWLGPTPTLEAMLELADAPVTLLAVHPRAPLTPERFATWRSQHARLARRVSGHRGPLILAGDLNATPHSRALRDLEQAGTRDVHRMLGRELASTWPNGAELAPPLLIDHVLVSRHFAPLGVVEGRGEGSNHRPVIADLALIAR